MDLLLLARPRDDFVFGQLTLSGDIWDLFSVLNYR